jgi:enediyne biosynthesis protein E3
MFPLLNKFLSINGREVTFTRRGFSSAKPEVRDRLEHVGTIFLVGYHAALQENKLEALSEKLERVELEYRGFSYEGAAMALVLRDAMIPGSNLLTEFMEGAGKRHIYMLHVGAGWACARLPWLRWRIEKVICKFDSVLRWLVLDGYGFHQGYFHFKKPLTSTLKRFSMDARRVFYQGFGRSLWFVHGCDFHQISKTISGFPALYQGDAWSGIGLACAYAGGVALPDMKEAVSLAGRFDCALAQGAAFAAKARQLARNEAAHTEEACAVLAGIKTEQAAALCDRALAQVNRKACSPYREWRELVQNYFSSTPNPLRGNSHEFELVQPLVPTQPD